MKPVISVTLAEAVPLDEKALDRLELAISAPFDGADVVMAALVKAGLPVTVFEEVCGCVDCIDSASGDAAAPVETADAELLTWAGTSEFSNVWLAEALDEAPAVTRSI